MKNVSVDPETPYLKSLGASVHLPQGFEFAAIESVVMAQIDAQVINDPWGESKFESSLNSGSLAWGICDSMSAWCGFALVLQACDVLELLKLAVQPSYQRRGLATALLRQVIDFATIENFEACVLEVRASNVAARALYARSGFDCVGTRQGYYPLCGLASNVYREDAKVYRKAL